MVSKYSVEKVMVVKPGVAVPNPGDLLYNASTKAFNLGIGGFGAYVDVAGSGNPAGIDPNTYNGELFRFIQRRAVSGDNSPLYNRVLEQSQYIDGTCHGGITIGGEAYTAPSNSAWLVGAPNASSTGNISVVSNNLYTLKVGADGYRTDMFNSVYNTPTAFGNFTSPNWVDTTISTTNNRRDYTVKFLARDFNRKVSVGGATNRIAVAMCLDTAGTTSGPTIASIIAGGVDALVTIGYDKECAAVNLLVTEGILQAFTNLEAALTASTGNGGFGLGAGVVKLAPYRFSDTCTSGAMAGDGSDTADMLFFIALDMGTAYYDEVPNTKRRITVGLDQGTAFTTARQTEVSPAKEGAGLARNLRILYENTEHYRSYTSSKKWGANHVSFPDQIIDTEAYDIYTISHCFDRVSTGGNPSNSTLLTMIALVNFEKTDSAYYNAGNPNPQKTYLESVLNAVGTQFRVPGPINL